MNRTQVKRVGIVAGNDSSQLSKGQKAFNSLIRQIEKKRGRLAAWEAAIGPYHRKYVSDMLPLIDHVMELQVKMVQMLDRAGNEKGLTKSERRKISSLITELAGEMLATRDDADLKAVYNRHSRSDYDAEEAAGVADMKSVLEDVLGLDLGEDADIDSPDELLEHVRARMDETQAQHDAAREAWQQRQAQRKKSAKQLAREAQQQADEQQLRQSISQLYRKLASAIHPDREVDPQERERKTVLMQRANMAYNKNNLLELLELQLELEHIEQSSIDNLGEVRLKHYNKILKEQLGELDQEILRVEDGFRAQFGMSPFDPVSPGTIMRDLAIEITVIRRTVRDMNKDLLALADVKGVKQWLKSLRHRSRTPDIDDLPF